MKKPEFGFSLVELCIVMAVLLIVAAMAVPSMRQVMDEYRLNASGRDVANMLQQTRMLAVHDNQPYYAQVGGSTMASPQSAIELAGGPVPPSHPTAVTSGSVAFQGAGLPDHKQLDIFVGATPPIPAAQINSVIAFNARGIACGQGTLPTNSFNCSPGTIGFEWFMQSTASNRWEAVTVTPAGRIKSWRQTSSGKWQ